MKQAKLPHKPVGNPRNLQDMADWQEWHYNTTRKLAEKYRVRFFEISLEHSGTEVVDLVDWLQLPSSFVGLNAVCDCFVLHFAAMCLCSQV
jgi:hypothetical protein